MNSSGSRKGAARRRLKNVAAPIVVVHSNKGPENGNRGKKKRKKNMKQRKKTASKPPPLTQPPPNVPNKKQRKKTASQPPPNVPMIDTNAVQHNTEVLLKHSLNPAWDNDFKVKIGKKAAIEFMTKQSLFPSQMHFIVTNDENEVSYYNVMKAIMSGTHKKEDLVAFDVFFCENRRMWKRGCNEFRTKLVHKAKMRYFSKYNETCLSLFEFYELSLIIVMEDLLKRNAETKKHLEEGFAEAVKLGRQEGGVHYMRMLAYFGDIFCYVDNIRRFKFQTSIASGVSVSNAITVNMEAIMRTIIVVGCGKDWPDYLKSPDYINWKQNTTESTNCGNKPVSFVYVSFRQ